MHVQSLAETEPSIDDAVPDGHAEHSPQLTMHVAVPRFVVAAVHDGANSPLVQDEAHERDESVTWMLIPSQ